MGQNDIPIISRYDQPGSQGRSPSHRAWHQKKRFRIPLTLLVIWVMLSAIASSNEESAQRASEGDRATSAADDLSAEATTDPTTDATEEAAGLAIGTPFVTDDFEYTVTGYECGIADVGGEFRKEVAVGQFCALALTAENIGNTAADLDYDDFKLVEGDTEYSTDSWINIRGNGEGESTGFLDEINPGLTVSGRIYFDVPTDVTPSRAVLSESWFADDQYVDLTQR